MRYFKLMCVSLFFAGFALGQTPEVHFERVYEEVTFVRPLYLTHDGSGHLFVLEQAGRVLRVDRDADGDANVRVVLDITDRVFSPATGGHNEEGLLGMALHPDFENNGYVFLHYSMNEPRRGVIARFVMDADRIAIAHDSEEIIMQVPQPFGNHNGGMIEFGPDGYLYIALGDGGSSGDPQNHGQRPSTLLGTILRIDVDRQEQGKAYAIPEDNPFAHRDDARPEIYAWGLRNVWRFSFDRETGDLWAGDVGQDKWEEINLIFAGENYGWNLREGTAAFREPRRGESTDLIDPIVEHPHPEAKSITGGYVYRGQAIPELVGAYIYGDYQSGLIWALRHDQAGGENDGPHVIGYIPEIASFGQDAAGEIYVVSLQGMIYRIQKR